MKLLQSVKRAARKETKSIKYSRQTRKKVYQENNDDVSEKNPEN